MIVELVGAALGVGVMAAVAWAMWVYHQRELDRALSDLRHLS